jgi:hypothetical protein
LKKADYENIKGKEVTPYILEAVAKITEGRSLNTSKKFQFIVYPRDFGSYLSTLIGRNLLV